MRYAVIVDGKVSSVVEWDGTFANPPVGHLVYSNIAEVGDAYDKASGTFPEHTVTAAELVTEPVVPDVAADAVIDHVEGSEHVSD